MEETKYMSIVEYCDESCVIVKGHMEKLLYEMVEL
jgi:hypothetical protein